MVKHKTPEEKRTYMLTEQVQKLVLRMAVPTVISMLVTSFYNMADTYFVSQLKNTSATGATGIIYPVMTIIQAFGYMLGQGSGNSISRALGRRDYSMVDKMSAAGLGTGIIAGILLQLAAIFFIHPIVTLLGATPTIHPFAVQYGRIIMIGAPWMIGSLILNCQLRLQGSANFSMIGLGIGAVINIALDPLMISVLDMGISGAAYATIISQFISFCILYAGTKKDGNVTPKLRYFTLNREIVTEILRGGLPALVRQSLLGVSTICMNNVARIYGDVVIAAVSIVTRIMNFAHSAALGIGQGFQPVCGFNYGAKKYDRVLTSFYFTCKVILGILLVTAAAGIVFSDRIIRWFSEDAGVIEFGIFFLRMQCAVFFVQSFTITGNMFLQNIGKTFGASLLSAARQGLFFIPALYLLTFLMGDRGLAYVQMASDICSFALAFPLVIPVIRELKKKLAEQAD